MDTPGSLGRGGKWRIYTNHLVKLMKGTVKLIILAGALHLSALVYAQSVPSVINKNAYPKIKKGVYQIINLATGKAAAVENDNSVVQKEPAADITQQWQFDRQPDGAYKITSQEGGKVLEVNGRKNTNGATIDEGNWDGNDSQRWYVRYSEKGHIKLLNKKSRYYMETPKGNTDEGRVLQQGQYFGFTYQEWKLAPVK